MKLSEKDLKRIIELHVRKQMLKNINERNLLKLPNNNNNNNEIHSNDIPMNNTEQMPPEEDMDINDNMDIETEEQTNNPYIDELVELLTSNPDRAEGVLKYAKGIIGDNTQSDNTDDIPMEEPEQNIESIPENRNIDLDEMINDILNGNKKIKPTINKPIGTTHTMKSKMYRPI